MRRCRPYRSYKHYTKGFVLIINLLNKICLQALMHMILPPVAIDASCRLYWKLDLNPDLNKFHPIRSGSVIRKCGQHSSSLAAATKAFVLAVYEGRNNVEYAQREHVTKSSKTHDV